MARTDTHRPSAINPEEYTFVACDYFGPSFGGSELIGDRKFYHDHMARTGGKVAQHHNTGTCHICGASAMYVARYHHRPTNTYITTGMDCADKMDIGEAVAFKSFRKRIRAGLKVRAGKNKAKRILEENGLGNIWNIYEYGYDDHWKTEEPIIQSIVAKLVQYGNISEKQVAFIKSLVDRIANRATIEAARAAKRAEEAAISKHIGTVGERTDFTLTARFVTSFETQFGTMHVHVMNDAAGNVVVYKGSNEIAKRGETVSLKATIKKHDSREGVAQTLIARPKVAA